jgi:hypothetical protein
MITETGLPLRVTISGSGSVALMAEIYQADDVV